MRRLEINEIHNIKQRKKKMASNNFAKDWNSLTFDGRRRNRVNLFELVKKSGCKHSV